MKIVIVHYHLKRGGVTSVLESCVPGLLAHGHEVLILSSEPPRDHSPLQSQVRLVSELTYDGDFEIDSDGGLAEKLRSEACDYFGGAPDVWHFHNHHLGKNFRLTAAVGRLGEMGESILLQIHDFPEDGRQVNYSCLRFAAESCCMKLSRYLYPTGSKGSIHYAVLNQRDFTALSSGGVKDQNLHSLPNPIRESGDLDVSDARKNEIRSTICDRGEKNFLLYPSRCIRRKNIGEVIFWGLVSSRSSNPCHIGLTLSPENPDAQDIYNNWKEWSRELDLPISFELGLDDRWEFPELLASCDGFLTTSVAEGFGLGYLEPWTLGKGIIGRNIPEITSDFLKSGIDFGDSLYNKLSIPFSWLDTVRVDFKADLTRALELSYDAYGTRFSEDLVDSAMESMVVDGQIDFARLSEKHMNAVLATLRSDSDRLFEIEPVQLPSQVSESQIKHNKSIVESSYSVSQYVNRLENIYMDILNGSGDDTFEVRADQVLHYFLDPRRFLFLCS